MVTNNSTIEESLTTSTGVPYPLDTLTVVLVTCLGSVGLCVFILTTWFCYKGRYSIKAPRCNVEEPGNSYVGNPRAGNSRIGNSRAGNSEVDGDEERGDRLTGEGEKRSKFVDRPRGYRSFAADVVGRNKLEFTDSATPYPSSLSTHAPTYGRQNSNRISSNYDHAPSFPLPGSPTRSWSESTSMKPVLGSWINWAYSQPSDQDGDNDDDDDEVVKDDDDDDVTNEGECDVSCSGDSSPGEARKRERVKGRREERMREFKIVGHADPFNSFSSMSSMTIYMGSHKKYVDSENERCSTCYSRSGKSASSQSLCSDLSKEPSTSKSAPAAIGRSPHPDHRKQIPTDENSKNNSAHSRNKPAHSQSRKDCAESGRNLEENLRTNAVTNRPTFPYFIYHEVQWVVARDVRNGQIKIVPASLLSSNIGRVPRDVTNKTPNSKIGQSSANKIKGGHHSTNSASVFNQLANETKLGQSRSIDIKGGQYSSNNVKAQGWSVDKRVVKSSLSSSVNSGNDIGWI